jgi:UDP-N-acetylmuramyl tripeptide synthase
VFASRVQTLTPSSTALTIETPKGDITTQIELIGLYNAYNAVAAAAAALSLGLPLSSIERAIAGFSPVFGRQETIEVDGRTVQVLLGKNPAGMNQVVRTLATLPGRKHLFLLLNDNIADGTDVSWVWDVDYDALSEQAANVTVSGTRPGELALRLKYAGFKDIPIVDGVEQALREAIKQTPPGETLYLIPTYTAMLQVREILTRWGKAPHYWEDGR